MVVGGSRERMTVPRVCALQKWPLLGIKWKLFLLPHPATLFTCCQSEKGSPYTFPRWQKIDLISVKW